MFTRAERRVPAAFTLIDNLKTSTQHPTEICDASLAFLEEVLALPPQKAGPLLRFLAACT
jgi:hypothetical protein